MTLREKNQNFFQKNHALLAPLLAALLGYAGFDGYQEYQKANGGSQDQTVTVNVESVPESMTTTHEHGAVVSRQTIENMVKAATTEQNKAHKCKYHGICDE